MTKDFNGCENGETSLGGSYTTTYSPSRVFIKQDQKKLDRKHWWCYAREIVWLGYSESLFLRAEAALRGWAGAKGTAEDLYKEGIEASFNYYQIGADEEGQEKISKYMEGLKGLQPSRVVTEKHSWNKSSPRNGLPYIPTVTKDGQSSAVQTIPAI